MSTLKTFLKAHPQIMKSFVLGFIVFAGCFNFPFGNNKFPIDFMSAYLIFSSYCVIWLALGGIYGTGKEKIVFLRTLEFTTLGLISRYLLEFGEVSNTMNFTAFNIISYILITPILTTLLYHFFVKSL